MSFTVKASVLGACLGGVHNLLMGASESPKPPSNGASGPLEYMKRGMHVSASNLTRRP